MKINNIISKGKRLSIKGKFDRPFPIVKDLSSLRKKGQQLEDMRDIIVSEYGVDTVVFKEWRHETFGSYFTVFRTNADKSIGIYYSAFSGGGIPSVLVGVASKSDWLTMRRELRDKGLAR